MSRNALKTVRPDSTFDKYTPQTETQEKAKATMLSLAEALIAGSEGFQGGQNPIRNATFYLLTGGVGTGKTHLLEAVINHVKDHAPVMAENMYLLREDFTLHTISGCRTHTFDNKPIIFVDDFFSRYQSVDKLHPSTDIKSLMEFISMAYDNRCLVIGTSNFPFLNKIIPMIAQVDTVGRTLSRCREMIVANSGEVVMDGKDYREVLAEQELERRGNRPKNDKLKLIF